MNIELTEQEFLTIKVAVIREKERLDNMITFMTHHKFKLSLIVKYRKEVKELEELENKLNWI